MCLIPKCVLRPNTDRMYCCFSAMQPPDSCASNQDIFSNLLQPEASQSLADDTANEHIIDMTCADSILKVVGIQRVLSIDDTVVVLVTVQQGWVIQQYDRETMTQRHDDASVVVTHPKRQHFMARNDSSSTSPHLCLCLLSGSTTAKQYDKNKHCCVIDARLFQQMFGEDVRLLESPVLLVSTPDGAIFSLSLKCTLGKQELHIVCHLQVGL